MARPTPATTPPSLQRRIGRPILRMAVFIALVYIGWCTVLFIKQEQYIFPRHVIDGASAIPLEREDLTRDWIATDNGGQVEVWLFRAPDATPQKPAPCVFIMHGNAELIDDMHDYADYFLSLGLNVCLIEYRGYGRSGGDMRSAEHPALEPSERGLVADALAALRIKLDTEPTVDRAKLLLYGRSLGAGVAAQVAARLARENDRPPVGIVLESPFLSVSSFAAGLGVPSFLVKHPFRTDRVLPPLAAAGGGGLPVLILHSRDDEIIPFSHAQRLARLMPSATLVELSGAHNADTLTLPEFERAIAAFLRRLGMTPP